MGIDCVTFQRLTELSQRIDVPRRSLMLGRQGFHFQPKYRKYYRAALGAADAELSVPQLRTEDGYSETALSKLGFGDVEAMDFSDFEGAQHIHDLNAPVPDTLKNQFDFILDGGTLEHVFNAPMALQNVFDMLKPNGVFVSANGMNGWYGHGLYQFGPDLVWSFWKRSANCEVMRCMAVPKDPEHPPIDLPDPAATGRRLRHLWKRLPAGRVYLYYEVRKTEEAALSGSTLQSDYQARWQSAAERKDVRIS